MSSSPADRSTCNSPRPKVLSVGQCMPDTMALRRLVEGRVGAELVPADALSDALDVLRRGDIALVLVNRKLDVDNSEGLDVITSIRAEADFAGVPVMLVSNYPEYQRQAVAAGAVDGFGKNELDSPATIGKLAAVLGCTDRATRSFAE